MPFCLHASWLPGLSRLCPWWACSHSLRATCLGISHLPRAASQQAVLHLLLARLVGWLAWRCQCATLGGSRCVLARLSAGVPRRHFAASPRRFAASQLREAAPQQPCGRPLGRVKRPGAVAAPQQPRGRLLCRVKRPGARGPWQRRNSPEGSCPAGRDALAQVARGNAARLEDVFVGGVWWAACPLTSGEPHSRRNCMHWARGGSFAKPGSRACAARA